MIKPRKEIDKIGLDGMRFQHSEVKSPLYTIKDNGSDHVEVIWDSRGTSVSASYSKKKIEELFNDGTWIKLESDDSNKKEETI